MKVIILAAGSGGRLRPLTNDIPKAMLEINGKTILERVIEIFRGCGIENIVVVRGYKKEKININYPDLKYYDNDNYNNSEFLYSLFCAEKELDDECIISYSDILFKRCVVEKLLQTNVDISVVVDTGFKETYKDRIDNPIELAETVMVKDNRVIEIGKIGQDPNLHGEFIGMVKFSKKGANILRTNYNRVKKVFKNKPFHRSPSIGNAYLSDMIQELIDKGYKVVNVDIVDCWKEIDTIQDFENAKECWKF